MKLSTICPNCNEQTSLKSNALDRRDLIRDLGETFNLQCNSCKKNFTVHVNDVRAQTSPVIMISALVLGILFTLILLMVLGAIATVTLSIPLMIWAQQNKAVRDFNGFMIKRERLFLQKKEHDFHRIP